MHSLALNPADTIFDTAGREAIEAAIRSAEQNTSGEIRVHIDEQCEEDVLDRAAFLFAELDMHRTALRNGVLIYLAYQDQKMAIIGDAGIHTHVGQHFWDDVRTGMIEHFKKNELVEGVVHGVLAVGEKLKAHFPYLSNDTNELPNEVTFGNTARK